MDSSCRGCVSVVCRWLCLIHIFTCVLHSRAIPVSAMRSPVARRILPAMHRFQNGDTQCWSHNNNIHQCECSSNTQLGKCYRILFAAPGFCPERLPPQMLHRFLKEVFEASTLLRYYAQSHWKRRRGWTRRLWGCANKEKWKSLKKASGNGGFCLRNSACGNFSGVASQ